MSLELIHATVALLAQCAKERTPGLLCGLGVCGWKGEPSLGRLD